MRELRLITSVFLGKYKMYKVTPFNFMTKCVVAFYKKNGALLSIFVILVVGLVSITWFRRVDFFSGTDTYFPQNRSSSVISAIFAWDDRSLGSISSSIALLVPYGLFLSITEFLEISLTTTQRMWVYYTFTGSGLSMFFLVATLSKIIEKRVDYTVALFAGLMFMFNPFVGAMATSYTYLWGTYAFLPLKLGLYIKGLTERRGLAYIITFILVWILTSGSQYTNPKYLILDLLPLFLFFLFYLTCISKQRAEREMAIKFSIIFISFLLLSCAYWLMPTLNFISEALGDTAKAYASLGLTRDTAYSLNSATSATNAIRLLGLWALHRNFNGVQYFNWIEMYGLPIVIIIQFALVFFSFVPFLIKTVRNEYRFFIFLNILSILGMLGLNEPLGKINSILIKKVTYFIDTFSYPYIIFGVYFTLSFVVLVAVGVYIVQKQLKLNKPAYTLVAVVLFVGVNARPVWTGEIFSPRSPSSFTMLPSNLFNIPDYYYKASDFLKKQRLESRIFPLPYSRTGGAVYLWDRGYAGIDITPQLIGTVMYGENPTASLVNKFVISGESETATKLLPFLNTRYILIHSDTHPTLYDRTMSYNRTADENLRSSLKKISEETSFDKLEIFRLNESIFLPHFYIPQNITSVNSKSERTSASLLNNNLGMSITLEDVGREKQDLVESLTAVKFLPKIYTLIEYKKINPVKYRIFVHSVRGIFPLVFSESFHPGWKTYINKISPNRTKTGEIDVNILSQYKILDGNQDDQADKESLMGFIDSKLITTLGNGKEKQIKHLKWEAGKERLDYIEKYNIGFISKNFQGTIQNDNLSSGPFWETWFPNRVVQIPEENHLMVNGYANSWVLDADKLCGTNSFCTKNPDGTYNMELIVEFWPQRLFYIGAGISGTALIFCIGYLIFSAISEAKNKQARQHQAD